MSKTAQVGGTHYQSVPGEQHWDLIEEFDIGYLEGNASKYVMRFDRKGTPVADLGKARSYIERLLESRETARRVIPPARLQQFYEANDMDRQKCIFFDLVHGDGSNRALNVSLEIIDRLLEPHKP